MNAGISFIIVGIIAISVPLCSTLKNSIEIKNRYPQWELADRSSTIEAKEKHIAEFVSVLEKDKENGVLASHSAFILKTPDKAFDNNFEALKTLASRLSEIKTMNPSSFEYNTAIQQVTQQEQGEASAMIGVLSDCYTIKNNPLATVQLGVPALLAGAFLVLLGLHIWLEV